MIRLLGKFCIVCGRQDTDQHHPWMNQIDSRCASTQPEHGWSSLFLWLSSCPLVAMGMKTWNFKNAQFLREKANNNANQAERAGWSPGCSHTELHLLSLSSAAQFSSLPCFCERLLKRTCGICSDRFTEPEGRVTTWEPLQFHDNY